MVIKMTEEERIRVRTLLVMALENATELRKHIEKKVNEGERRREEIKHALIKSDINTRHD